jgi:hypothetical protein
VTPKEIAENIIEIHRNQNQGIGWIGDAICDAFRDTEILAKSYLELESRLAAMQKVVDAVRNVVKDERLDPYPLWTLHKILAELDGDAK